MLEGTDRPPPGVFNMAGIVVVDAQFRYAVFRASRLGGDQDGMGYPDVGLLVAYAS